MRDSIDILSSLFYSDTPKIVLFSALMFTTFYIARRGLRVIGRSCWFCFGILEFVVSVLVLSQIKDIDITNLYPIWGPGKLKLLKEGVTQSAIFNDMLFIAIFAPNSRSFKDFKKGTLIGLFLALINFAILCIVMIGSFGYPNIRSINYPFQILARAVDFGRFATNIEAIFLGFWVIAVVFRYSIYLYVAAALLGYTVKINNFEKLLFPIALAITVLGLIPENFVIVVYVLRREFLKRIWIFFIVFPVLLWLLSKARGELKNEKG